MFSINPARPIWITPALPYAWQRRGKAEGEQESTLLPSQGQRCHRVELCYICHRSIYFSLPDQIDTDNSFPVKVPRHGIYLHLHCSSLNQSALQRSPLLLAILLLCWHFILKCRLRNGTVRAHDQSLNQSLIITEKQTYFRDCVSCK